jgi:hypothetical protein
MGKAPQLKGWQDKLDSNADEITLWGKLFQYATNTGVLTARTPAFDIDIRDAAAAKAIEDLVREWLGERPGELLVRVGKPPKRAVLFQTNTPFKKVQISLQAPDGSTDQKLEFLATASRSSCSAFIRRLDFLTAGLAASRGLFRATHSLISPKKRRESSSRPLRNS